MEHEQLKQLYRQYLLEFMREGFDELIDCKVLSFEEFVQNLNENKNLNNIPYPIVNDIRMEMTFRVTP